MADGRAYLPGAHADGGGDPRAASRPPGRARAVVAEEPAPRAGPVRPLLPAASGEQRRATAAPVRDHLADDRALLRPPATGCGCRPPARCTPAWPTTTPSTCAGRCTRAGPEAVARTIRAALAREAARAHLPRSSASADPARRWYRSADDDRRARLQAAGSPTWHPSSSSGWPRCAGSRASAWTRAAAPRCSRCAKLAADYLREAGAQVDVIETGGFPMVVGRIIQDPSFPTVTVYNHLDVQPADAAEAGRTPAVRADARRERRGAARWFARGTTDDKGPALTALYGARLALEDGVRANIQFLWELEEEIGSPNFAAGLAAAVAGDAAPDARRSRPIRWSSPTRSGSPPGKPSISYGLRGLMGFTVALADRRQGRALGHHRRRSRATRSASWRRCSRECYDARTGKVKIPGFYADVRKLSAAERKAFARAGFSRKRFAGRARAASAAPMRDDLAAVRRADRGADARGARHRRRLQRPRHQDHRPPPRRGQAVDAPGPRSAAGQGVQAHQALHQEAPARRGGHARGVAGAVSRRRWAAPTTKPRRPPMRATFGKGRRSCAKAGRSARC